MKTINNNVFLSKISQKIKNGEYDTQLSLPFMTKELLYITIRDKIQKKIDTGGTPILSEAEVKECIADVKESAVNIIALYLKLGFMKKTENGFEMTEKMQLAIKAAYRA
jgi:hypothetical protein